MKLSKCNVCNDLFHATKSHQKYCSQMCSREHQNKKRRDYNAANPANTLTGTKWDVRQSSKYLSIRL